MRQSHIERLFATMDKLSQIEPPLSQEEIDAEIEAARRERRARRPARSMT
jgi:hypothetical protein